MKLRTLGIAVFAVLILMPFTSYGLGKADIAVIDVGVDSKCNWVVTMQNVGNTQLPPTAMDQYYGAAIQIKINGANDSGWSFGSPLKMPGSIATYSKGAPINGTVTLGATYEANGSYEDTNLSNNTLSKVVSCTPPPKPQPDLTITSLDFTPDCRPHIKMANIGSIPVSDWYYQRIYLQRRMDNVPAGQLYIKTISPNGVLKQVQGTADFIDSADYVPQSTLRYNIDISGVVLDDANSNNDSATVNLPDRCKPGANLKKVLPQSPNLPAQKQIQDRLPR
jgi:hypothetical protein